MNTPRHLFLLLGLPAAVALAGCGAATGQTSGTNPSPLPEVTSSSVTVSAENFGDVWPFTAHTVTLSCEAGDELYVQPEGSTTRYGLNDNATAAGAPAPTDLLVKDARIGAVRSFGLETCKHTSQGATP